MAHVARHGGLPCRPCPQNRVQGFQAFTGDRCHPGAIPLSVRIGIEYARSSLDGALVALGNQNDVHALVFLGAQRWPHDVGAAFAACKLELELVPAPMWHFDVSIDDFQFPSDHLFLRVCKPQIQFHGLSA